VNTFAATPAAHAAIAAEKPAVLPAILLSSTIFLGAFLLFLLEPLFAKLILPRFGGSAAVWGVCLVFFQSALLLGYMYADYVARRLTPRRQALLHIGLLLASLLFLPIAPHGHWKPAGDPAWRILGVLMLSIGLPFVLLSATSPLLQSWQARLRWDSDPYRLFAVSNLASLLALLSFPFLIEPRLSSHAQTRLWSALFALFVVICSISAWIARSASAPTTVATISTPSAVVSQPSLREKFLWLGLAACGSMLLLSITNHLLEDVSPVPLLWVLPLALYLLTFTLAFARRNLYSRWLMVRLLAVALASLGYAIYEPSYTESIQVSVPFFCTGLFLCCWFCHGELAKRRPAPEFLTSFYVMVSLGGALGAIFVGLAAPHIFSAISEFPLSLVLTALLAMLVLWPEGWHVRALWAAATLAMAVILVVNARNYQHGTILRVRNFYAALRVKESTNWLKEPYRTLFHGKIEHGAQFVRPPMSLWALTYYGPDSGVGLALTLCCGRPKRVGVIGLGVGSLAAYGKSGDYFRFYEINPQVISIAQSSFSYLRDTQAIAQVVLGDARLSLESEPPQRFDVLAVDAFSGDAIPVHLLTKEAFALYFHHLAPGGILAVHTSNTYLDLPPVVQLLAKDAGYSALLISSDEIRRKIIDSADWVLVARNFNFLDRADQLINIEDIVVPPHLRLWTDDYNNLFRILRPVKFGAADSHAEKGSQAP
jgi:hypothetical protein